MLSVYVYLFHIWTGREAGCGETKKFQDTLISLFALQFGTKENCLLLFRPVRRQGPAQAHSNVNRHLDLDLATVEKVLVEPHRPPLKHNYNRGAT